MNLSSTLESHPSSPPHRDQHIVPDASCSFADSRSDCLSFHDNMSSGVYHASPDAPEELSPGDPAHSPDHDQNEPAIHQTLKSPPPKFNTPQKDRRSRCNTPRGCALASTQNPFAPTTLFSPGGEQNGEDLPSSLPRPYPQSCSTQQSTAYQKNSQEIRSQREQNASPIGRLNFDAEDDKPQPAFAPIVLTTESPTDLQSFQHQRQLTQPPNPKPSFFDHNFPNQLSSSHTPNASSSINTSPRALQQSDFVLQHFTQPNSKTRARTTTSHDDTRTVQPTHQSTNQHQVIDHKPDQQTQASFYRGNSTGNVDISARPDLLQLHSLPNTLKLTVPHPAPPFQFVNFSSPIAKDKAAFSPPFRPGQLKVSQFPRVADSNEFKNPNPLNPFLSHSANPDEYAPPDVDAGSELSYESHSLDLDADRSDEMYDGNSAHSGEWIEHFNNYREKNNPIQVAPIRTQQQQQQQQQQQTDDNQNFLPFAKGDFFHTDVHNVANFSLNYDRNNYQTNMTQPYNNTASRHGLDVRGTHGESDLVCTVPQNLPTFHHPATNEPLRPIALIPTRSNLIVGKEGIQFYTKNPESVQHIRNIAHESGIIRQIQSAVAEHGLACVGGFTSQYAQAELQPSPSNQFIEPHKDRFLSTSQLPTSPTNFNTTKSVHSAHSAASYMTQTQYFLSEGLPMVVPVFIPNNNAVDGDDLFSLSDWSMTDLHHRVKPAVVVETAESVALQPHEIPASSTLCTTQGARLSDSQPSEQTDRAFYLNIAFSPRRPSNSNASALLSPPNTIDRIEQPLNEGDQEELKAQSSGFLDMASEPSLRTKVFTPQYHIELEPPVEANPFSPSVQNPPPIPTPTARHRYQLYPPTTIPALTGLAPRVVPLANLGALPPPANLPFNPKHDPRLQALHTTHNNSKPQQQQQQQQQQQPPPPPPQEQHQQIDPVDLNSPNSNPPYHKPQFKKLLTITTLPAIPNNNAYQPHDDPLTPALSSSVIFFDEMASYAGSIVSRDRDTGGEPHPSAATKYSALSQTSHISPQPQAQRSLQVLQQNQLVNGLPVASQLSTVDCRAWEKTLLIPKTASPRSSSANHSQTGTLVGSHSFNHLLPPVNLYNGAVSNQPLHTSAHPPPTNQILFQSSTPPVVFPPRGSDNISSPPMHSAVLFCPPTSSLRSDSSNSLFPISITPQNHLDTHPPQLKLSNHVRTSSSSHFPTDSYHNHVSDPASLPVDPPASLQHRHNQPSQLSSSQVHNGKSALPLPTPAAEPMLQYSQQTPLFYFVNIPVNVNDSSGQRPALLVFQVQPSAATPNSITSRISRRPSHPHQCSQSLYVSGDSLQSPNQSAQTFHSMMNSSSVSNSSASTHHHHHHNHNHHYPHHHNQHQWHSFHLGGPAPHNVQPSPKQCTIHVATQLTNHHSKSGSLVLPVEDNQLLNYPPLTLLNSNEIHPNFALKSRGSTATLPPQLSNHHSNTQSTAYRRNSSLVVQDLGPSITTTTNEKQLHRPPSPTSSHSSRSSSKSSSSKTPSFKPILPSVANPLPTVLPAPTNVPVFPSHKHSPVSPTHIQAFHDSRTDVQKHANAIPSPRVFAHDQKNMSSNDQNNKTWHLPPSSGPDDVKNHPKLTNSQSGSGFGSGSVLSSDSHSLESSTTPNLSPAQIELAHHHKNNNNNNNNSATSSPSSSMSFETSIQGARIISFLTPKQQSASLAESNNNQSYDHHLSQYAQSAPRLSAPNDYYPKPQQPSNQSNAFKLASHPLPTIHSNTSTSSASLYLTNPPDLSEPSIPRDAPIAENATSPGRHITPWDPFPFTKVALINPNSSSSNPNVGMLHNSVHSNSTPQQSFLPPTSLHPQSMDQYTAIVDDDGERVYISNFNQQPQQQQQRHQHQQHFNSVFDAPYESGGASKSIEDPATQTLSPGQYTAIQQFSLLQGTMQIPLNNSNETFHWENKQPSSLLPSSSDSQNSSDLDKPALSSSTQSTSGLFGFVSSAISNVVSSAMKIVELSESELSEIDLEAKLEFEEELNKFFIERDFMYPSASTFDQSRFDVLDYAGKESYLLEFQNKVEKGHFKPLDKQIPLDTAFMRLSCINQYIETNYPDLLSTTNDNDLSDSENNQDASSDDDDGDDDHNDPPNVSHTELERSKLNFHVFRPQDLLDMALEYQKVYDSLRTTYAHQLADFRACFKAKFQQGSDDKSTQKAD